MKTKFPKKGLIISVVAIAVLVGGAFAWAKRPALERSIEQATLPKEVEYKPTVTPTKVAQAATKPTTAPASSTPAAVAPSTKANLAVPFTAQAPHANWDDPYGELCEEASILMTMSYIKGQTIPDANFADKELLAIKAFEDKRFGYYKDTNAAETELIINEYYKYDKTELIQNPTVEDIKKAITAGKVVIVPAAGRDLGNPYFQSPGPLYHMFVIKGYTANNKFITNDPGTRRGADFLYDQSTIMSAIHDWRPDGDIEKGKKVVLVVG